MHLGHCSPILKSDAETGTFEGLAWSFRDSPDRQGDIILPSALQWPKSLPLLHEHKGDPVGEIRLARVVAEGLHVEGRIADRAVRERVRAGSSGLSIAFQGQAEKCGPVRVFTEAQLFEISVVAEPANAGSRITSIKSWSALGSEIELQRYLKTTGMPGRLASKIAATAWPIIEGDVESDAAVNSALSILANSRF